jgi:hypothetical protein
MDMALIGMRRIGEPADEGPAEQTGKGLEVQSRPVVVRDAQRRADGSDQSVKTPKSRRPGGAPRGVGPSLRGRPGAVLTGGAATGLGGCRLGCGARGPCSPGWLASGTGAPGVAGVHEQSAVTAKASDSPQQQPSPGGAQRSLAGGPLTRGAASTVGITAARLNTTAAARVRRRMQEVYHASHRGVGHRC